MPQGVSPAVTETVPELQILREQHDKAQKSIHEDAQSKLRRLNQEYLHSLDNLIGQLTRQSKLASTLAVRAERNRLLSIMAADAVSKDKAERDDSHPEKPSPVSRPMLRNGDYIYLGDLSVISAQADRFWQSGIVTQDPKRPGTSLTENFKIGVSGVKILKLRVDPLGSNNSDHATWIDPRLRHSR